MIHGQFCNTQMIKSPRCISVSASSTPVHSRCDLWRVLWLNQNCVLLLETIKPAQCPTVVTGDFGFWAERTRDDASRCYTDASGRVGSKRFRREGMCPNCGCEWSSRWLVDSPGMTVTKWPSAAARFHMLTRRMNQGDWRRRNTLDVNFDGTKQTLFWTL